MDIEGRAVEWRCNVSVKIAGQYARMYTKAPSRRLATQKEGLP
jgi:hypothetical protein